MADDELNTTIPLIGELPLKLVVEVVEKRTPDGQFEYALGVATLEDMEEGAELARVEAGTVIGALRGATAAAEAVIATAFWRDAVAGGGPSEPD